MLGKPSSDSLISEQPASPEVIPSASAVGSEARPSASAVGSERIGVPFFAKFANSAFDDRDCASLVLLRIVIGFVFAFWAWDYLKSGQVDHVYSNPAFHFKYSYFEWVAPPAGHGMLAVFVAILLLAVAVASGAAYFVSSLLLASLFTYVFLCERTNYQNHYYLMALLAWWMPWVPLNRRLSFDAWWQGGLQVETVPGWCLQLTRFHIALPYFFGGVAKLSPDWLAGEPMRQILASKASMPIVGSWLATDWATALFTWGGLAFDLSIVPFLLIKTTRMWAYCACVLFHLMNATLFDIHIFPWFMIAATTIFFEPNWPRRLLLIGTSAESKLQSADPAAEFQDTGRKRKQKYFINQPIVLRSLLAVYVVFHLLWPLRSHLTQGDPSWTEQGHLFAWRMMLRGKISAVRYYVTDPEVGTTYLANLRSLINVDQANRFPRDPVAIVQLAKHIAAQHKKATGQTPEVRVLALTSLNGRKPQMFLKSDVNLMTRSAIKNPASLVMPLEQPLSRPAWNVPLVQWEEKLSLPKMPTISSQPPS